jgi:hypothetical protein
MLCMKTTARTSKTTFLSEIQNSLDSWKTHLEETAEPLWSLISRLQVLASKILITLWNMRIVRRISRLMFNVTFWMWNIIFRNTPKSSLSSRVKSMTLRLSWKHLLVTRVYFMRQPLAMNLWRNPKRNLLLTSSKKLKSRSVFTSLNRKWNRRRLSSWQKKMSSKQPNVRRARTAYQWNFCRKRSKRLILSSVNSRLSWTTTRPRWFPFRNDVISSQMSGRMPGTRSLQASYSDI